MSQKNESYPRIKPEKIPLETDHGIMENEERKWGIPLKDVYKHSLNFFKEKDGKAFHLSYEDKLELVAYTQQVAHGPFDISSAQPLGVFDMIGRDRRNAWQALGQMSQIQAMSGFIHILDRLCPLFKPYIEAIVKDFEEKKQKQLKKEQEEKAHKELQNRIMEEKQKQQSEKLTEEQQVQRIKDALNAQSYNQFLQYAQQQYPGNYDQQAILIRQLQDQHYQQYVQQLAVDQRLANSNINCVEETKESNETEKAMETVKDCNLNDTEVAITDNKSMQTSKLDRNEYSQDEQREDDESDDGFPAVEDAVMWTRGDITQFKESARSTGGKLTVGHGETVTVRVPTHHRAKCLCWEFATDNYDIGFGLYFEWSKSPTTEVTIHVSESDDEEANDDDGYGEEEYTVQNSDPEAGSEKRALSVNQAPVSLVVPIYRRDCHTEVYAGSHTYPGEGVYLLKFDNTYSLWRSKTLYYKVYYTQ